eukprot:scaffold32639_cov112-Isochrysis_galbana.AAC.4
MRRATPQLCSLPVNSRGAIRSITLPTFCPRRSRNAAVDPGKRSDSSSIDVFCQEGETRTKPAGGIGIPSGAVPASRVYGYGVEICSRVCRHHTGRGPDAELADLTERAGGTQACQRKSHEVFGQRSGVPGAAGHQLSPCAQERVLERRPCGCLDGHCHRIQQLEAQQSHSSRSSVHNNGLSRSRRNAVGRHATASNVRLSGIFANRPADACTNVASPPPEASPYTHSPVRTSRPATSPPRARNSPEGSLPSTFSTSRKFSAAACTWTMR